MVKLQHARGLGRNSVEDVHWSERPRVENRGFGLEDFGLVLALDLGAGAGGLGGGLGGGAAKTLFFLDRGGGGVG